MQHGLPDPAQTGAGDAAAAAVWQLRLTGAPALLRPDGRVCQLDRHGALLAARVALDGPQPRNLLAAWLWPDLPAARSRANLRQRLLRLRQQAGTDWLQGGAVLQLAPGLAVLPCLPVDAGDLLAGIDDGGDTDLADWLAAQRRALAQQRVAACASSWQAAMDAGDWRAARQAATAWRLLEPLAEAPALALARAHHRAGDAAAGVAVLQALGASLQQELHLAPGADAQAMLALLRQSLQADATPPAPLPPPAPDGLARPPMLVERAADLATLAAAWAPTQLAWVAGPAGSGCTRLLQHWGRARSTPGAAPSAARPVVWVTAEPGDAAVPGRLLQRLAEALGLPAWPDDLPPAPGGCVLDALHFADDSSLARLPALAASWPVPLALGSRPLSSDPRLAALAPALAAVRRVARWAPPPWSVAGIAQLLRDLAWPVADPAALSRRLHDHTGGHPCHVLDTLRALHATTEAAAPLPAPLPVSRSALQDVADRLPHLPPEALALLRLATLAGPEADAALLARVLQRSLSALADDWQALADAVLLGANGRPHGLAQAAVRAGLPAPVAVAWHQALAEAAEQTVAQSSWAEPVTSQAATPVATRAQPDDRALARIAAHWLDGGLPQRAVPWLLRAADAAHAALRPADEARHLARAADVLAADAPDRAVDLLLRLVRVAVEAQGIGAAAAPLDQALALATDGAGRARVLLVAAEAELNALRPEPSAQAAEQALAAAPAASPQAAEAVLRLHKAWCLAGRAADAEALWQHHAGWLHDGLLPDAEAVSDRGWVLDRLGQVREARRWHQRALARARAGGRPVDEAVVLGNLAQSLVMSGEPQAAEAVLDQLDDRARHHDGLHSASDYSHVTRATAAALSSDPARALALFDKALDDAARQSAGARAAILVRRAGLWAAIGQTARALADADAALAVDGVPDWTRLRGRWLRAWLAPAGGAPRRCLALQSALQAGDAAQWALCGSLQLWLGHGRLPDGESAARQVLAEARAARRSASAAGHAGLRWAAHWMAAQAAVAARRPAAARRHLRACLARPPGQVALDLPEGVWWHGLWRVAQALGDSAAAATALRAGRAWLADQQARLPDVFRASFVAAVPAHQALQLAHPPPP